MASRGKYAPLNADSENGNKSKYVSDLDEIREDEPRRGILHGRGRYYLAGFAAILVISVVTLAAVLGTNSGNLPSHFFVVALLFTNQNLTERDKVLNH